VYIFYNTSASENESPQQSYVFSTAAVPGLDRFETACMYITGRSETAQLRPLEFEVMPSCHVPAKSPP